MQKLFFAIVLFFLLLAPAWATDVVVQAISLPWTGPSTVEIRFFLVGDGSTTTLRTPEAQVYSSGTVASGTTTIKWDCTVAGGNITIPSVVLPGTTNAVGGGRVRWAAYFFNKSTGLVIRAYAGFEFFQLPHYLVNPTWYDIRNYNALIGTATDPTIPYGRGETDAKIAAAITSANPGADPSQTGQAGKVLMTNGTSKSWEEVGANGTLFDRNLPSVMVGKTLNTATINSPTLNTPNIQGNTSVNGTVIATAFVGNGAGLTGITGATGGVSNAGSTTIIADNDANGSGILDIQVANQPALQADANKLSAYKPFQFSSYLKANLPSTSAAGMVARTTDDALGLWLQGASGKWYSLIGGEVDADEYASLSAAIAAIGSNYRTLRISSPQTISANISFPTNIYVVVVGNGSLTLNNAAANFDGGFYARANRKVFFFTGTGRVTFGNVDCTGGCTQAAMMPASDKIISTLHAAWWVVGDAAPGAGGALNGTDDTTNFQKMLDVLPGDSHVILDPGLACKTTADLNLKNRKGVVLDGLIGVRESGYFAEKPFTLIYNGPDGGTIFHWGQTRNSELRHCLLLSAPTFSTAGGADRAIWFDNGFGSGGGISSANTLYDVTMYGMGTRASFVAVDIGNASNGSNDEYHTIEKCSMRGGIYDNPTLYTLTGIGVRMNHSNVKKIILRENSIMQCQYGVRVIGASFQGWSNAIGGNTTNYYFDTWGEPIEIFGDDSESSGQVLKINGGGLAPVTFSHCRWDRDYLHNISGTTSLPLFDWGGSAARVALNDCYLGNWYHDDTSDAAHQAWFTNNTTIFKGSTVQGSLKLNNCVLNNFYEGYLLQNFLTFLNVDYDGQQFGTGPTSGLGGGIQGLTSAGSWRNLIRVQQATQDNGFFYNVGAQNSIVVGDGHLELLGIPNPNATYKYAPFMRRFGGNYTNSGSTQYQVFVLGVDAGGRRTMRSQYAFTQNAMATLSSTDKLEYYWPAMQGAASYVVLQANPIGNNTYRVLGTPTTNSFTLSANPVSSYTYILPTYNETMQVKRRGQWADAVNITFSDGAATPSVASTNRFTAANTSATTITNFTDGIDGQTITVSFTTGNTTIANNANIKTASGANINPLANTTRAFLLDGAVWKEIGGTPTNDTVTWINKTLTSPTINSPSLTNVTVGGGTVITQIISATATLDFDLTSVASQDLTMTATGAALGDTVALGVPHGSVTANTVFFAWVSASNTITVRAQRVSGTPDPASGTFRVTVTKF